MNFKWDKKYLYWGVTAFLVIAAATVFFLCMSQVEQILERIFSFLSILTPVLYGFIIAYILAPVATFIEKPCLRRLFYTIQDKKRERFERLHPGEEPPPKTFPVRKVARVLSVVLTIILALALLTGMIWILLPQLIDTVTLLVSNMPGYVTQISDWVSGMLKNYPDIEAYVLQFTGGISDMLNNWLSTELLPQMNNIWTLITSNVMNIVSIFINLLLGFVIAIYFLNSKELFAAQAKKIVYCLFKTKTANKIIYTTRDIHKSFGQFITGKLIDSFIIGALYILIMSALQMDYAILAGVIMGVTSIIPFFGPFIGAVPCVLLLLLSDPVECLYFIIMMIIIQQIDGNILAPKIIGDSTGLSSFWVIFGMLLGQGIFGFAGLIIGIPMFAVIYSLIKNRVANGLSNKNPPSDSNEYRDIHHIDSDTGEAVMFPHPPYMKKIKEKHNIKDFLKHKDGKDTKGEKGGKNTPESKKDAGKSEKKDKTK